MSDAHAGELRVLAREVVACDRCPRLRRWRERVGEEKRRAFATESYWSRPVPGFGDPQARILLVGLAPGAHGANRTGRLFTGDRSGDFLFASLHRVGLASQATSTSRDDGLVLRGVHVTAAARCAPPANRPTPAELARCRPFLLRELEVLSPHVAVALGGIAWSALLAALAETGEVVPRPRPRFAHGAELALGGLVLLGAYHPSQQNTFTRRLVPAMLDEVLRRAIAIAGSRDPAATLAPCDRSTSEATPSPVRRPR